MTSRRWRPRRSRRHPTYPGRTVSPSPPFPAKTQHGGRRDGDRSGGCDCGAGLAAFHAAGGEAILEHKSIWVLRDLCSRIASLFGAGRKAGAWPARTRSSNTMLLRGFPADRSPLLCCSVFGLLTLQVASMPMPSPSPSRSSHLRDHRDTAASPYTTILIPNIGIMR
jgi:hypothetical protein